MSGLVRVASWVAERELAVLLVLAPFLLFPTAFPIPAALALLSLPLLWACRWLAKGRLTQPSPLDIPILALLLMLPVSLLVSAHLELSLPKYTVVVLGVALYYAIVNCPRWREVWLLIPPLGLVVVVWGFMGIEWSTFSAFKVPLLAPLYRYLPDLGRYLPGALRRALHPNEVGGTLAMLMPLVGALWGMATVDTSQPSSLQAGPAWSASHRASQAQAAPEGHAPAWPARSPTAVTAPGSPWPVTPAAGNQ